MNLLAIDPASSSGFCLFSIDNNIIDIKEYGFVDVDKSSEYIGDWCLDLEAKLIKIIKDNDIKHIVVEDYFFGSRFASGCNVNSEFRAAIHILVRRLGLTYTIVNPSEWKRFICGSARPSKEQKKKWGKEPSRKIMVVDSLWKKYQIKFPNHSISDSGKPIKFRYDVVDAVGQAIYYGFKCMDATGIKMSVGDIDDVDFSNKKWKMYKYE